jgi:hypothetical protein
MRGYQVDVSTLQLLALMAVGVAVIVGISLATSSTSPLLRAGGHFFNAALIAALATAVFSTPAKDADTAHVRNIVGLLLLAAAGWTVVHATRAYQRKR